MSRAPSPIAHLFVQRDLQRCQASTDKSPIIFVDAVDGNLLHLEAAISGPLSTPYEDGIFLIRLIMSENHPFTPPESITLLRAIMHPNIDEIGHFRSELLDTNHWSPITGIQQILEHVWARLAFPDVDSNYCDRTRAQAYKTDKTQFERVALEYTQKYA